MTTAKWYQWFESMAVFVSEKSKDKSTGVGCVIINDNNTVLSLGYNGFPRKINDDIEERHQRPAKYLWVCHAEINAICNAAREGHSLEGATLVMNFAPYPCADCVKAIIQSGIKTIVGYKHKIFPSNSEHWLESIEIGKTMMMEAGIEVIELTQEEINND